jgi:catechol 2,3-dioxygenase
MTTTEKAATPAYGIAPPNFRLPDATRIGRVRLQVADLDRSIGYYESVIGLRLIARHGDIATLGPHDDDTVLVELHAKAGVRPTTRRGLIGLYHFAILLPTRAALGRFVRHLASIGAYAGMSDHFVSEAVYLQDPDGLGIEVYADRPRSTWRIDNRQLAMASEPLDVASLLAEAGNESWTGAPKGTTIGHVHLYVRDIDQAAAFYHEGLGFDKIVWSYPGALFMSAGGYHHHLGTNTWAASAALATDDDARMLEWELLLPDASSVNAAAEHLASRGISVDQSKGDAVIRDPWGTQLRIVAAR